MKIASAAEACEVNVAPHNFYGHLCTMMNAHFSAAVPNLRIMETDIDRLPWDHELFNHVPEIENGHLIMPERPGWGTRAQRRRASRSSAKGQCRAFELWSKSLSGSPLTRIADADYNLAMAASAGHWHRIRIR